MTRQHAAASAPSPVVARQLRESKKVVRRQTQLQRVQKPVAAAVAAAVKAAPRRVRQQLQRPVAEQPHDLPAPLDGQSTPLPCQPGGLPGLAARRPWRCPCTLRSGGVGDGCWRQTPTTRDNNGINVPSASACSAARSAPARRQNSVASCSSASSAGSGGGGTASSAVATLAATVAMPASCGGGGGGGGGVIMKRSASKSVRHAASQPAPSVQG